MCETLLQEDDAAAVRRPEAGVGPVSEKLRLSSARWNDPERGRFLAEGSGECDALATGRPGSRPPARDGTRFAAGRGNDLDRRQIASRLIRTCKQQRGAVRRPHRVAARGNVSHRAGADREDADRSRGSAYGTVHGQLPGIRRPGERAAEAPDLMIAESADARPSELVRRPAVRAGRHVGKPGQVGRRRVSPRQIVDGEHALLTGERDRSNRDRVAEIPSARACGHDRKQRGRKDGRGNDAHGGTV